jgi:hypothetical protein
MTAAFVAIHLGDPITATARRYPSERVANVLRGALHPFLRFIKSLHTLIWAALLSLIVWSGESTLFGLFLAALGTLLPSTPRYGGGTRHSVCSQYSLGCNFHIFGWPRATGVLIQKSSIL